MASLSDAMYTPSAQLTQVRFQPATCVPIASPMGASFQHCANPVGMDATNLWATFVGGSDRVPADYPCTLQQGACPSTAPQECGKSLRLRENTVWGSIFSSADGTGYVTSTVLTPMHTRARLGNCWASRVPLANNPTVSQLFIDDKPALYWNGGGLFLFHSNQSPFVYMVPNALMARVSGLSFHVDISTAAQQGLGCDDCL